MNSSRLEIRDTISAMLVFADIVDSSIYSSVLGYKEYAKRLLNFQESFTSLAKKYFPEPKDRTKEFREINARGDEGVLFFAKTRPDFSETIFRVVEFLFHLKGRLRFAGDERNEDSSAPRRLGLGAGIHVGKVAFATKKENNRSVIDRLEGFSINYAKRVESSSRRGKYSHIFLSKNATRLLEDKPILFSRVTAPMKGIDEKAELYEVKAGLFGGLKLDFETFEDNRLVEKSCELSERGSEIDEPWIKSFVVSVLDCLLAESIVSARRAEYKKSQLNLAWHSSIEDDPILLYLRSREFGDKKDYTQQIRYLRQIIEAHPEFFHARKMLIKACWSIAQSKAERAELVFARDMAKEFLERYPHFLTDGEKREFKALIKQASGAKKG